MRLPLAVIVPAWITLMPLAAMAAQEFPYRAYVNTDDVYVRSGPGEDYYPTDKLKAGQEVEIYRHDPGGWYAIRPPQGSFTWIAARYLDAPRNRVTRINADRVAGRVGSRFSDIRDVIQVRLQKGEMVEILETKTAPDGDAQPTVWCKIAPPSGEFRWLFGKYVDPDYPRDGVRRARADANPIAASPTASRQGVAMRSNSAGAERGPRVLAVAQSVEQSPPDEVAPRARARRVAPAQEAMPDDPAAVADERFAARGDSHRPAAAVMPMRQLSPEEFQKELESLDLELSIMLAEETSVWTFEQLGPRAAALVETAQTAVERGRARVLANKIARFDEIKRRYDAVNTLRRDVDRQNGQLAALGRQQAEAARAAEPGQRFDGSGRLLRVASPVVGAPRYALVDGAGQVRSYVSPAPGVNLQYYLGQEVGIHGVRGYMPEQHAEHIMAKHVTVIEQTQLR